MENDKKEYIPIYHVFVDILNATYTKVDELIKEAQEENPELGIEINNNVRLIIQLLIEKHLKEFDIPEISQWRLQTLTKGKSSMKMTEIIKIFEPFERCFLLFSDTRIDLLKQEHIFSEKAAEFLQKKGINTEMTPDLLDKLKKIMNNFLIQGEKYCQNNSNYYHLLTIVKDVLFANFIKFANMDDEIPFKVDIIELKKFSRELGLVSNEKLLDTTVFSQDIAHPLLDIDELIDDYLSGRIKRKNKKYTYIFKSDFIKEYIKLLENGENEKAKKIVKEFKMKDVIEAFHNGEIDFEFLLQIIKSPYFHTNSREVRGLFLIDNLSKEAEEEFVASHFQASFHQIFELAQMGLVDDIDLMMIYCRQEEIKEQDKSVELFSELYELITEDELRSYFDTKRFLDNYFNHNDRIKTVVRFYITYVIKELHNNNKEFFKEYSKKLIDDDRINKKDIVEIYFLGMISSELFKEYIDKDSELKSNLYDYIKKNLINSMNIFTLVEEGIIDEWDMIEIFPSEEEMEKFLREGIRTGNFRFTQFPKFSYFQNTSIIVEEYKKSVEIANQKIDNGEEISSQKFLFEELIGTFVSSDGLVSIEDIKNAIKERKDPIFKLTDFNLGLTICAIIIFLSEHMPLNNINKKIEELYMKSYIIKSDLEKLVEKGIISEKDANNICVKFARTEAVKKLNGFNFEDSEDIDHDTNPFPIPRPIPKPPRRKDPITRESLEAKKNEFMIEILKELSFEPVMTKPNSYGISELQRFESGNFGDYAIFLSKKIPECVILMHCKQVPYTDIYYQEGGNATYIMEISLFMQYLRTQVLKSGELANFTGTKLDLKTHKLVRTANSSKNWGVRVAEKIEDIRKGMGITFLTEHKEEIKDMAKKEGTEDVIVSMLMQIMGRSGKLKDRISQIENLFLELGATNELLAEEK